MSKNLWISEFWLASLNCAFCQRARKEGRAGRQSEDPLLLVCDSLRWQHRVQKVGKNLSNPRPVNHLPSFYCSRGPTSGHWRCSHHEAEELQSRLREGGQLGHSIYSQIPQTRRYRKLSESPPLSNVKFSPLNKSVALFQFVYVNQAFSPSPDQTVGNLCDCYGSEGKLVLYYSKTQAWG